MNKRLISEYTALLPLLCCMISLLYSQLLLALIFYAVWYFLFGFVGLASYCYGKQRMRLSKFFLIITVPIFLVPFRKALYNWLMTLHIISEDSENTKKAFVFAQKVNPKHLYTDHNRSMFYSYLAALYIDMGDKQTALAVFEKAEQTPHKSVIDAQLKSFREEFFSNNDSEELHAEPDLTV